MTETVTEMVESVERILDDRDLSKKVVRELLKDFGGMQVYLPLASAAFKADDDKAIYDEFDGINKRVLCRKYDITFNTFYEILRREKERRAGETEKRIVKELDFS